LSQVDSVSERFSQQADEDAAADELG